MSVFYVFTLFKGLKSYIGDGYLGDTTMNRFTWTQKLLLLSGLGVVLLGNIMAVANNSVAWLFWCVVIGLAFFGTTHYLENR